MLQRHYAHAVVGSLERELERARQHPALAAIEAFAQGQNAVHKSAHQLRPSRDGAQRKRRSLKLVS